MIYRLLMNMPGLTITVEGDEGEARAFWDVMRGELVAGDRLELADEVGYPLACAYG